MAFTSGARPIYKSLLIEVKIPANTNGKPKNKIQLPDEQNLRNTHLFGIETYNETDIPMSIQTHTRVISEALLKSTFLTLQGYNGKNFAWQIPLIDLYNVFDVASGNPFNTFPYLFCGQKVNWPKSYIEIADTSLISLTDATVVVFNVYYKELQKVEANDKKANFRNRK